MRPTPFLNTFFLSVSLASMGTAHAAGHWGAWSEGTPLRPPQYHEQVLAGFGGHDGLHGGHHRHPASGIPPGAGEKSGPVLDVRLRDATHLVGVTTGLSYNPATGQATGPITGSGSGSPGGNATEVVGLAVHQGYEPFIPLWFPDVASISELTGASPATGGATHLVTDYGVTLDQAGSGTVAHAGSDSATQLNWGAITGGYTQSGTAPSNYTTAVNTTDVLYIYGPAATAVPTTGTFNYTLVGSVLRNNVTGRVGGTLNSASLSINFTAATADFALSATVGSATFTASASGLNVGTLNAGSGTMAPPVTTTAWSAYGSGATPGCTGCTGGTTLDANVIGRVTGAGASGALMAFNVNARNGSNVLTEGVSGVAAFKK